MKESGENSNRVVLGECRLLTFFSMSAKNELDAKQRFANVIGLRRSAGNRVLQGCIIAA